MRNSLLVLSFIYCLILFAGCDQQPSTGSTVAAAQSAPAVVSVSHTIKVGSETRSYLVHIPASKFVPSMPLVILLHGATDSADYALQAYHFAEKADSEGFVLVAPDAVGEHHAWRALDAAPNPDVDFLSAMLKEVTDREKIDTNRVYFVGHSVGAAMAYRYAADNSDRVAGVGAVAGFISRDKPNSFPSPKLPVPIIAFHCDKDENLPFDQTGLPAVKWWAEQNHCLDVPHINSISDGITLWTFYNGKASVVLYEIPDGNHMWPGGYAMPGKTQTPVLHPNATDLIWDFFQTRAKTRATTSTSPAPTTTSPAL